MLADGTIAAAEKVGLRHIPPGSSTQMRSSAYRPEGIGGRGGTVARPSRAAVPVSRAR